MGPISSMAARQAAERTRLETIRLAAGAQFVTGESTTHIVRVNDGVRARATFCGAAIRPGVASIPLREAKRSLVCPRCAERARIQEQVAKAEESGT